MGQSEDWNGKSSAESRRNYGVILRFLIDVMYICFVVLLCYCYLLSIIEKYSVFYFCVCLSP